VARSPERTDPRTSVHGGPHGRGVRVPSALQHFHMKDKDITAQAIVGTYLFVTLLVFLAYFS